LGITADGMTQHDTQVGQLLDKLDELGIAENTIVIYTTDNGAEKFTWPDGGTTPFKGEKATTWEGGIRIPFMIRWPGKIEAGTVSNEIISLEDCLPTLLAAAGDSDIKSKLLNGHKSGGKTFKVHLDGYNYLPYLTGETEEAPRKEFFAFVDDGSLGAVRYERFKFHFSTQETEGLGSWLHAQEPRKAPLLIDLLADPFEQAPEASSYYDDWLVRRMFAFVPLQRLVGEFMATFQEFPVRQEPGSFTPKQ
jgi:arylsulfatase A-like enzyme